jgi:phosphoribosyl-ATP pyrophosphohydrolase/phosphoribosyl-AMP cyclohydrolase
MENNIKKIDFDKGDGVVPVIAQNYEDNEVLMLAYMDKAALEATLQSNFAHYFSRSKQRMWKKGETSGHTQEVKEILYDCDNDTILLKVIQKGVACHTGRESCFFTNLKTGETTSEPQVDTTATYGVIDTLYHTLLERKSESSEKSYTSKLINGDENSLLKKIVEEAGEFTFAVKDKDEDEMIYEAADITYHVLVALAKHDISPDRVKQELARRFGMSGIDEKNSRTTK